MSDRRRALVSLRPRLQIAASQDEIGGGPWTDQQWMHDRLAVEEGCLTLFTLGSGVHQVDLLVHRRQPNFDGEHSDEHWAHVVEASWTPPASAVCRPPLVFNEGEHSLQLPDEPCRICWRLGWFDPELVDDESPWGTHRAELHLWPARPAPLEVRKLWDGETPELPDPPPVPVSPVAMALGCAMLLFLLAILFAIPAGVLWLLWLALRTILRALGLM